MHDGDVPADGSGSKPRSTVASVLEIWVSDIAVSGLLGVILVKYARVFVVDGNVSNTELACSVNRDSLYWKL